MAKTSSVHMTVGNDRLYFPLTPDKVTEKDTTTSISFQIIKDGEHKIPRGTSVTGYSWSGTLPNIAMASLGFVDRDAWLEPTEIIKILKKWQKAGKIIKLVVTGVGISDDVFIENLTFNHRGPGLVDYQINVSAYRPVTVTTAPPQPKIAIPLEKSKPPATTQPPKQQSYRPPTQKPEDKPPKTPLSVAIPTSTLVKPKQNSVVVTTSPTRLGTTGVGLSRIAMVK